MFWSEIEQFTSKGTWESSYTMHEFVETLEKWITQSNLNMYPDFQRGNVWTREQAIAYVEYILRGGQSARVIYLNDPNWGTGITSDEFVCVEGLQRANAMYAFIRNQIPVFGNLYFKDFKGRMPHTMSVYINVNNLKTRLEVLQWYRDLNTSGTPHTEDEIVRIDKMIADEKIKTNYVEKPPIKENDFSVQNLLYLCRQAVEYEDYFNDALKYMMKAEPEDITHAQYGELYKAFGLNADLLKGTRKDKYHSIKNYIVSTCRVIAMKR